MRQRLRRLPSPAMVLAASALLVALGRYAPFYTIMVSVFPPLQVLRYPVKAMVDLVAVIGATASAWWPGRAVARVPVTLAVSNQSKRRFV